MLELKPLSEHLKYTLLGEQDTLPKIIASDLMTTQQGKLLDLLKVYKATIGWTIADLLDFCVCAQHTHGIIG